VLGRRKPAEGLREVRELLLLRERVVRARVVDHDPLIGGRELVPAEDQLVLAAAATRVVHAGVARDLVKPGAEGAWVAERREAAVCGEEGLLDDVLGAALVSNARPHKGADAFLVMAEQRLERLPVAGLRARDELLLSCRSQTRCRCRHRFHGPSK
jgi:hypothetical protein